MLKSDALLPFLIFERIGEPSWDEAFDPKSQEGKEEPLCAQTLVALGSEAALWQVLPLGTAGFPVGSHLSLWFLILPPAL